jgi:AraC family transcriptional regulator of adaptative response/methylated-DNA-[protein]-cysteine methyltransferase
MNKSMEFSAERIRFGAGRGSLGTVLVAWSEHGVCAILLGDDVPSLLADLRRRFPHCLCEEDNDQEMVRRVMSFLEAPTAGLDLRLDLRGTPFQRRVWTALAALPPGATTTYGALATELGVPDGARAIAAACAANPVAVAIPCHRVIRRDGKLCGYRWGIERKAALLARESCVLAL